MRKFYVLILLSLVFFTGCIPVDIEDNYTLNYSGGGIYSTQISLKKADANYIGFNEETARQKITSGLPSYVTFNYSEEEQSIHMTISFSFNDIEDYKSKMQEINKQPCEASFSKNSSFFTTSYSFSTNIIPEAGGAIINSYSVIVKMPGQIKNCSGSIISNDTARFDITGNTNISANSESINIFNNIIIFTVLIGLVLIRNKLATVLIGLVLIRNKPAIDNAKKKISCEKCGASLKPNAKFCEECGETVTNRTSPETICPDCKAKLRNGAGFCEQCGYKVSSVAKSIETFNKPSKCSSCGAKLKVGGKFCEECGENVF